MIRLAPLLFLVSCLFASAVQAAGVLGPSGTALAWPLRSELIIEVAEDSPALPQRVLVDQMRKAFIAWGKETNTAPKARVSASPDKSVENGQSIHRVNVQTQDWIADADTLAVTTYTYKKSTGEITDADILINGTGPCLTFDETTPGDCYDASAVLLHEVGHFLGLDHVVSTDASIMYPTLAPGDGSKRKLEAVDASDIRDSYPAVETVTVTAGFAAANTAVKRMGGCASLPGSDAALWLVMLTFALRRVVRRRASLFCLQK